MPSTYTIIGLMSGTSLDGVDAALLETNGTDIIKPIGFISAPYPDALRKSLRHCLSRSDRDSADIKAAEKDMTLFHAELCQKLIDSHDINIDAIGFHGQTIFHDPDNKTTIQIGDGALLAEKTGHKVVYDFRSADVAHGGQGAPLLPLYHRAIALQQSLDFPITFLNIGGVSNITQINGADDDQIFACDTGPGNALIDDYMNRHYNKKYDTDGIVAKSGVIHQELINHWLEQSYFKLAAPKSLDRDAWDVSEIDHLPPQDAIATLSAFTVQSIAHHIQDTKQIYVCGGGRHNRYIMDSLSETLSCSVNKIEDISYSGDAIEAQGFAYLTARILNDMPISLPLTTGVQGDIRSGQVAVA